METNEAAGLLGDRHPSRRRFLCGLGIVLGTAGFGGALGGCDRSPSRAVTPNAGSDQATARPATPPGGTASAGAPLVLRTSGGERALPRRYLGANSPVPYTVPYEDSRFVPAVKQLAPAWLRFPGGTIGNYWNWRTRRMEIPRVEEGASVYRKYLIQVEPLTWRGHPNGISVEQFRAICDQIGADFTIVPNLESSTIAEQAAWFADMQSKGVVPSMIEMGNEFYLSLLGDALTKSIFPDWETTLRRTKEYRDAFEKYLPANAKIAVQAASARLHHLADPGPAAGYVHDEWVWDEALRGEAWFQAVISHPYASPDSVVPAAVLRGLPGTLDMFYPAFIARVDEGFDRAFGAIAAKVPDKEIWVTEWGHFAGASAFSGAKQRPDGTWLHQVARALLAQLRQPAVTVSTIHALFFDGGLMALFRAKPDGTGYEMIGDAGLLGWFNEAANGGATYQRVRVEGAKRITASGTIPGEGFDDVDACLLRKGGKSTLFVHNAWKEAKRLRLGDLLQGKPVERAEAIVTADLLKPTDEGLPAVTPLGTGEEVDLPGYAVARVVW